MEDTRKLGFQRPKGRYSKASDPRFLTDKKHTEERVCPEPFLARGRKLGFNKGKEQSYLASSVDQSSISETKYVGEQGFMDELNERGRKLGYRRGNKASRDEFTDRSSETGFRRVKEQSCSVKSVAEDVYDEDQNSDAHPSIIGTCPDMCPARERAQRERLRDLAVFERLNGDPQKTSPTLAAKKFCRTISMPQLHVSDIRPLPVLRDTLIYLLRLLEAADHPFEVVHNFVFDRTRSIRQDLSMQNIINEEAILMHEQMVKFHIISHYKLPQSASSASISSLCHLNLEQLTKTLKTLFDLYEISRSCGTINKNRAEFYSYYVLLHLGPHGQSTGESLSVWFRRLDAPLLKSREMQFARNVLRHFRIANYKRFFSLAATEASYLQLCLMESFFNEVRTWSLACINHGGYKLYPYPISHLSKLLMLKEWELESLCSGCGLLTSTDEAGRKVIPAKQTGFTLPQGGLQKYSFPGLEGKIHPPLYELLL
ncbi:hypothetical protein AMTRI_Chr01g128550 [Amborella trichopoda]